jgi:ribosomal protein L31E
MIYVFKLISGEEIIGALDSEDETSKNNVEYFNITGPMTIVDGYDGYGAVTMKLRDSMLLSDEEFITIPCKSVITYYSASKIMIEYYKKAIIFAREFTKKKIERQIKEATEELNEAMAETSMEKVLRELRIRNFNSGNDSVN